MTSTQANRTDLADADKLWKSADMLRGQIDAAEYKHVVLGLLFLDEVRWRYGAPPVGIGKCPVHGGA